MNTSGTPPGQSRSTAAGGRVVAVNILYAVRDTDRPGYRTGIDKRPVSGDVVVGELGLAGDRQVDLVNHGGLDRAVYAYAAEDLHWWADRLDRPLPPGLFGENLTLAGVDVTGAVIGEQWRVGESGLLLEVTMPRTPCYKFTHRMGEKRWLRRFTDAGMPGAYMRVLATGTVQQGDGVEVVHRPGHGVTLGDAFRDPQPEPMARLLAAALDGGVRLATPMLERAQYVAHGPVGSTA